MINNFKKNRIFENPVPMHQKDLEILGFKQQVLVRQAAPSIICRVRFVAPYNCYPNEIAGKVITKTCFE
jgi:predicted nucleotide-binding protein (sugar kinase/HSP70/actin superfamily)